MQFCLLFRLGGSMPGFLDFEGGISSVNLDSNARGWRNVENVPTLTFFFFQANVVPPPPA
jgi:hypothetical protein